MGGEAQNRRFREALARVLSSSGFRQNERLSAFLRFLVERHLEGKDAELKESVIAVNVFGRKPDYDPKLDSIVRTEAIRLRAKLLDYYTGEGATDPVVIEVPKGGYRPAFRFTSSKRRHAARWIALIAALVLIAAGLAWRSVQARFTPIRIAVLPLENVSHDPANEYFADALTDEIISNLSIIDGLSVRSRTSSFAFKGKPRNIRDAAKQLDVAYILEGSVLRAPDQVRINAQLVRVEDDSTVWSRTFDRPISDVLAIQDEISRGIVNSLRLQLGRGRRKYEISVEAYDLYLRGRALASNASPVVHDSIPYFEQATAKDPGFAPAYAALAAEYAFRSTAFPENHPPDELARMRAAAEKALELDPLLAEAHAGLAMMYARDGQWEAAEESFRRAIALDPNRSKSYIDFSMNLLWPLGRTEAALDELRIAQKTDPLSSAVRFYEAWMLLSLARYDEAASICSQLPASNNLRGLCVARASYGQGKLGDAIRRLANDPDVSTNPQTRGFLGYFYAKAGRRDRAAAMAAASRYPNEQALILAGLGDKDRFFDALERMQVLGAQRVGGYLTYPELAPLMRDEPRLQAVRRKAGLPAMPPDERDPGNPLHKQSRMARLWHVLTRQQF
jgi:TolB-like protein/Flp pilus assembly protein TadD